MPARWAGDHKGRPDRTQKLIEAARTSGRDDIFYLAHGGPISRPEDVREIVARTDVVGFVGASSLERLGVEDSIANLTREFKSIPLA